MKLAPSLVVLLLLSCAMVAVAAPPVVKGKAASEPPAVPGLVRDCPDCPEMMVIPAGRFLLGSAADAVEVDAKLGEAPPLPVVIARPYAMGRHEITVAEYRAFSLATHRVVGGDCRVPNAGGWTRMNDRHWENPGFAEPQLADEPVVCVSWDDARAYADWLSKLTGHRYRLPSETEWEYAARGGTTTARYFGDRDSDEHAVLSVACEYANVYDTSATRELAFAVPNARCNDGYTHTAPVGSFKPNAFDLFDMIGNAREWLQDCYTASYVGRPMDARPWEWGGCELRGVRGGSWASRPSASRSAARDYESQGLRQADLGFRLVREL